MTIRDPALKSEAVRLRVEERLSLPEILRKVPVAKSTLSLWLREYPLTEEEKGSRRSANAYTNLHPRSLPKKTQFPSQENPGKRGSSRAERGHLMRRMYLKGFGCRVIANQLGLKNSSVYRRLKRMGVLRTRQESAGQVVPKCSPVPYFSRISSGENLNKAAVGVAVGWFLNKGYMVSLPVEPTHYDLVVESDEGLKRVQIKTTTVKRRGSWVASVCRTAYSSDFEIQGAGGKRRKTSYTKEQVDLFFILTGDGSVFLIPLEAVESVKVISLSTKYVNYRADVVKLADTQP